MADARNGAVVRAAAGSVCAWSVGYSSARSASSGGACVVPAGVAVAAWRAAELSLGWSPLFGMSNATKALAAYATKSHWSSPRLSRIFNFRVFVGGAF